MGLIELQLLLLIMVANGAPILCAALFKGQCDWPLDNHCTFLDDRPLLGPSKTWRGLLCALTASVIMAWLLRLPLHIGLTVGCFAMLGDVLSSFTKRRLGLQSSSMALGLDQLPEVILPLLAMREFFDLRPLAIVETTTLFVFLELILSQILYRLRIRKQPY